MSGYTVIEEVKKRTGIDSDSQMSILLNKKRQYVSNLKKRGGEPEAEALLDLMIAGNLSAQETKELLSKKNENGFTSLSLLIVTAVVMSLIYISNLGYSATLYTLCEVTDISHQNISM